MKRNTTKAFSLIELSIVILIIGILIAGVTQSSRLVAQSRLSTARTLTQSAPPSSMRNLVLWYETTSDKSFDSAEQDDGVAVTNWYDINPTSTSKINSNSSGTTRPLYKANCINGLPCLNFDGINDFMDTTNVGGTSTTMTYIMVINPTTISTTANTSLIMTSGLYNAANGSCDFQINNIPTQSTVQFAAFNGTQTAYSTSILTANKAYIIDAVDDAINVNLYFNGTNVGTIATGVASKTLNALNIGSYFDGTTRNRYFTGYIGEVLIFDRNLKTEERRSIEAYLGKKWGIKVS